MNHDPSTFSNAAPPRQIRAVHDAETVRVYQAYGTPIADALLRAGRFVEPTAWTEPRPEFS